MNKKSPILLLFTMGLLLLSSCADEDLSPIITFDQAGKGAYIRLIELRTGEFDLKQFNSSAYDYTVEFVDLEQGDLVTQYDLFVSFSDNTPDNGSNPVSRQLYTSFSPSDFSESDDGFKSLDVTIPLADVTSAIGLSESQLAAGDVFRFFGEITLQDGSVFTAQNSSATIRGSAFAGFFNFTSKVTCPLPDDQFTGTYTISYVDATFPFGPATFGPEGTQVTLSTVAGSSTKRSFDAVYLQAGGFGQPASTFTMDFVCDIVVMDPGQGTGLGCGGTITIGPSPTSASVDISDDSSFTLFFDEFVNDGGCGVGAITQTVKFTKS